MRNLPTGTSFRDITFIIALLGLIAAPSMTNAATYTGNLFKITNSPIAHEATSDSMTPPGGYPQLTKGAKIFWLDTAALLTFVHTDLDNDDALSDGDVITIQKATLPIFSVLDQSHQVGEIDISGVFNVGGPVPIYMDNGLSGELDFEIRFSEEYQYSLLSKYNKDDVVSGKSFYQAGAFNGRYNGISTNSPDELDFALWGSSRGPNGGTLLTIENNGTTTTSRRTIGFDISAEGSKIPELEVPEPAISVTLSLALGTLLSRRRRTNVA